MKFEKLTSGDLSTYPKKEGKYLIKFFNADNNYLPEYLVAYFKEYIDCEGNETKGFFFDEGCAASACLEGPVFKHKVFEYVFLPNLLSKEGEYNK